MGGSTPRVLLCTCQHTLPLDGKRIAAALGGQAPAVHSELCAAEADAVSRALDPETPLLIGCTQEAPLFAEIAGEAAPHATSTATWDGSISSSCIPIRRHDTASQLPWGHEHQYGLRIEPKISRC